MSTSVCIYTRISSDPHADTDDGGLGVARQEKECRALAERLGWTVANVYCDNDISAYNGKRRPEFEKMLTAVKRGQYDALVCWHPDRLYRSMRDIERVIEICDAAGVPIRTVNGGDLDLSNATGKALARILGSINRMESEHKAERIKAAKVQRAEAGVWFTNTRVFGYTMDGKIVPAEAKLVRQAAKDILAGRSTTSILREWNSRGILTAKGNTWKAFPFKRMLTNPRYAGLCEYRGKVIGPGQWRAIINPEDHAGLVALLNDGSRRVHSISWERKYLGSYRYECGKCGAVMKQYINNGVRMYRCTARAHLARKQPELDELVEATALEHMRDQKRLAKALAAAKRSKSDADPAELRARRASLQAQKDELAALFTEGVLDGPAVRRESGKITDKIAAVDAALAEMARRSPLAEMLSEGLDKLGSKWAAATPDIKGKVIDELFTVVVLPIPPGGRTGKPTGFDPDFIEFRLRAKAVQSAGAKS
jgi:site-specific DNA recombinase